MAASPLTTLAYYRLAGENQGASLIIRIAATPIRAELDILLDIQRMNEAKLANVFAFGSPRAQYLQCSSNTWAPTTLTKVAAPHYLDDWYLVTALVPSDTACLASSPGRIRRTEVWISRELMVERLL